MRLPMSAVFVLVPFLAACGGNAEEASEQINEAADADMATAPAAEDGIAATDTATVDDAETGANGNAEVAAATASPTPTPSASPTTAVRATPAPTPTQVAAAGPPSGFTTCAVCHSVERGRNGIGPALAGVFGRRAGSVTGFNYSDAMEGANITWNAGTLERYLADPNAVVPGTTMPSPGLSAGQRAEVIAYLRTL